MSIDLSAHQLQLLAINALFEQARCGVKGDESCASGLRRVVDLGVQLGVDPSAVALHQMNDAEAQMFYHALF